MAKLFSSYCLCPLIEQKNLIGVSDDGVAGCVIVTLAKNIVIRFKLSDQSQVSFWSCRDKLGSPVVYDSTTKQYIGVFNGDLVGFWQGNCVELNKVEKYQFVLLIHSILTAPGIPPIVVFSNGHICPLSIENRKDTSCDYILSDDNFIEDAKIINISGIYFVCLLVRSISGKYFIHFVSADPDVGSRTILELDRGEDVRLVSHAVIDLEECRLITFWSDGKIFSAPLLMDSPEKDFPGRVVCHMDHINPSFPAAMVPISPNHIAIYGAEGNSEGAVLAVFNLKFAAIQTSTRIKLYRCPPRLWRCGSSHLVLVFESHLAVVPFRLADQKLSRMVGAHANVTQTLPFPNSTPCPALSPIVDWTKGRRKMDVEGRNDNDINLLDGIEIKNEILEPDTPQTLCHFVPTLQETYEEMTSKGLLEKQVCERLFPVLLEGSDIKSAIELLSHATDPPEPWLFEVVKVALVNWSRETSATSSEDLCRVLTSAPLLMDRSSLALARSSFDLPLVIKLLGEISKTLEESSANERENFFVREESRLLDWAALLLDSHYQQYLLSKDNDVVHTLRQLKETLDKQLQGLKDIQILRAHICHFKKGKHFTAKPSSSKKNYAIDKIKLF